MGVIRFAILKKAKLKSCENGCGSQATQQLNITTLYTYVYNNTKYSLVKHALFCCKVTCQILHMQCMTDVHSTTSTDNCNHICVDSLRPFIEDIISSIDVKTITLSMVSKKTSDCGAIQVLSRASEPGGPGGPWPPHF